MFENEVTKNYLMELEDLSALCHSAAHIYTRVFDTTQSLGVRRTKSTNQLPYSCGLSLYECGVSASVPASCNNSQKQRFQITFDHGCSGKVKHFLRGWYMKLKWHLCCVCEAEDENGGEGDDDLTQLTYEEHRTLSKVLHESLKTFKATLDYAEMDEGSSMSDSDLSDDSSDLDFVPRGKNFDYALRPVAANQSKKSNAAVASSSSTTKIGKPAASDHTEGQSISKSTKDGRNSVSRYPYSLRRRRQVVEQSSSTKSSNISSDESVGQNHGISAGSSVKKTKSEGEHASTSTEDIEATATELKTDAAGMDGQTSSSQSKSFNVE
ncbi:hypothetical protein T10_12088 [Trichinella papuae]|uniref:Uncharacterized protein n=1 Tax=Trichinella papuae TaxID=268474 RepID=A0A0V1M5Y0_9BILA|nr:hypothetical protein T10_12088 [Trichinella papuae]